MLKQKSQEHFFVYGKFDKSIGDQEEVWNLKPKEKVRVQVTDMQQICKAMCSDKISREKFQVEEQSGHRALKTRVRRGEG